ncbi:hypothetical protein PVAND_013793 [Polypedilum vanderplanki]|uniref:Cathepsin propeptide inhibitor domain-containing protein n=1 Tax=Polypedilum vanderplanki TaxID=319348 RepID=A0A9J6CRK6_POLVA|nr:hypothetical protein PVAND_013793 [Polypedilum vanderplanki]
MSKSGKISKSNTTGNIEADKEAERFEIFKDNLKKINEHNEKFKIGEFTYSLGINHFADKKPEELHKRLGGLKRKRP